jgi:hypothetical protein
MQKVQYKTLRHFADLTMIVAKEDVSNRADTEFPSMFVDIHPHGGVVYDRKGDAYIPPRAEALGELICSYWYLMDLSGPEKPVDDIVRDIALTVRDVLAPRYDYFLNLTHPEIEYHRDVNNRSVFRVFCWVFGLSTKPNENK